MASRGVAAVVVALAAFLAYRSGFVWRLMRGGDRLFTADEMSTYDGVHTERLYLALMGRVYDVSAGEKHYGPEGGYSVFVGRDASRAFITGEFDKTIENLDDVSSLSPKDLVSLETWFQLYDDQYVYKGKLIGRYYDAYGGETDYMRKIRAKIEQGKKENLKQERMERRYPPCNSEWSAAGSRVWCTKKSGGISRNWVGVPRHMHVAGLSETTCVCIDLRDKGHETNPHLRVFKGCEPDAESCRTDV